MGIPTISQVVADPKGLAQSWALSSRYSLFRSVKCYFGTVAEMGERSGKCIFHIRMTKCRLGMQPADITVAGLPCQPFSLQRGDRGTILAQDHPAFSVILDFLLYLRQSKAQGGIVEQVMGFGFQLKPGRWRATSFCQVMPYSWAAWFVIQLEGMGFFVKAIKMDNSLFSDVPRERTTVSLWFLHVVVCACFCFCIAWSPWRNSVLGRSLCSVNNSQRTSGCTSFS